MDAFKKFFEKKKADAKFKLAGHGQSLSSNASQPSAKFHPSHSRPQSRATPTQGARQAGAAALARLEQTSKKGSVDWSSQAIKAQARRELEAERAAMEQMKLNEKEWQQMQAGPQEVQLESAPILAVQGVYFSCPLIGPEIASYDEIKRQIRDFLYSQIEEDRAISSCIIIHTCNKNKEKVSVCIETLCKYIANIVSNPTEEKYRKIRISNKAYQERVHPMEGTKEFLEAAGFTVQELPFNDTTEKFWVFPEDKLDVNHLEQLLDSLVSAEPIRPQLDRNMRVLLPAEAAKHVELPPEFFILTSSEQKKEFNDRALAVERSQMLMTKAMRKQMEIKELRKYRFSLIRVRFPDGLILQGTFGVNEKFEEVLKFVRENLVHDWRPVLLSLSGGGKVTEDEQTLVELQLVPAVLLNFEWDPEVQDPNVDDSVFLRPETLALLQGET